MQAVRLGHAAIFQRHESVLHHPQRHLGLDLLDRKARISLFDDEAFDLSGGFIAGPDDVDVGEGGISDPLLLSIEDPCVVFAAATRRHTARGRGADQRFGEAKRADLLQLIIVGSQRDFWLSSPQR